MKIAGIEIAQVETAKSDLIKKGPIHVVAEYSKKLNKDRRK